jgi:hypothetical protein
MPATPATYPEMSAQEAPGNVTVKSFNLELVRTKDDRGYGTLHAARCHTRYLNASTPAVVHSIIFHRMLGTFKPAEHEILSLFGLLYV